MLVRAVRADIYRLLRNRGALFWGFLFIPLVYVLMTLVPNLMMRGAAKLIGGGVDPLAQAARSLAVAGNPFAHLFFAMGAASILGGEYRFATWRLVAPRLPRTSTLIAKWWVFVLFACASLTLVSAGTLVASALSVLAFSEPIRSGLGAGAVLLTFAVSAFELAAFASVVASAAILTRTVMGAVMPPFIFSLAQSMLGAFLPSLSEPSALLGLPSFAGDTARRYAIPVDGLPPVTAGAAAVSIVALVAWAAFALLVAVIAFRRQDLSRE